MRQEPVLLHLEILRLIIYISYWKHVIDIEIIYVG